MVDYRERIWATGTTLRQVAQSVGCVEAHFHRVISGKIGCTPRLAKRIEAATGGAIRWVEFFEDEPTPTPSPIREVA